MHLCSIILFAVLRAASSRLGREKLRAWRANCELGGKASGRTRTKSGRSAGDRQENATGAEQGGNGKKIVRHFGETQKRASAGRKNFWSAKCEKNLCGQKQEFIQVYNIEGRRCYRTSQLTDVDWKK